MFYQFIEGIALGLALGTTCLITCGPVYLSILMQNKGSISSSIRTILLISVGRFFSYALFGLAAGFLGGVIGSYLKTDIFITISYVMIGIYLIYSAVFSGKREKGACPATRWSRYASNPLILGLITGISVCPAFLGALLRGFDLAGPLGGMLLFIGFFIGTTLYMVPLGFVSILTKKQAFRIVGILFSIGVGLWFFYLAGERIYDRYSSMEISFIDEEIYVVDETGKFNEKMIEKAGFKASKFFGKEGRIEEHIKKIPEHSLVLLITEKTPSEKLKNLVVEEKIHCVYIEGAEDETIFKKTHSFLAGFNFKARKTRGFLYRLPIKTN